MWSTITEGPGGFCDALTNIGVNCSQNVLQINVWHLIVGVIFAVLVSAISSVIFRYKRLDTHFVTYNLTAPHRAIDDAKTIKLHPNRMVELLDQKDLKNLGPTAATEKLNERFAKRYFIVEFREAGRKVYRGEARLVPVWQKTQPNEIRLDPETMAALKKGSASDQDDNTDNSVGVDGVFDLFARKIRWWDIRHWIFHPDREVRIGLRVAGFIALLEYSSDIWKALKAILAAPF
ncbi:hypothetical protein [Hyphomonas sp.]|uniref:hypothetical protein n=1 Tax=Hyphomonas sp. TaxID=87 RepID=UPI003528C635